MTHSKLKLQSSLIQNPFLCLLYISENHLWTSFSLPLSLHTLQFNKCLYIVSSSIFPNLSPIPNILYLLYFFCIFSHFVCCMGYIRIAGKNIYSFLDLFNAFWMGNCKCSGNSDCNNSYFSHIFICNEALIWVIVKNMKKCNQDIINI